jgi:histidyl-tRNA synthetase
LQVFDVKNPAVREALADAPKIGDSLCDACQAHFDDVRRVLDAYGVPYVLDQTLVRGLDYYSRTTFEFIGPDENANSTICGGGRYDGLIEQIGGSPTPAIGLGAGIERLLLALENEGRTAEPARLDVFFVVDTGARRDDVLQSLAELRRRGVSADADYAGRSFKGQMTQAGRTGARAVVIVRGEDATIRRAGADEQVVALGEVVATLTP